MAFVFVVYARFPEILDMVTGSALHLARFLMVLALLATLLFGGAIRAVFSKIGMGMLAFTAWMCICVPFSVWRGGSARALRDFWVLSLFSFVIIAASVQGLDQCRRMMYTLAAATALIELFTILIGRVQAGRMALLGGTLGNANYLAMMLLMGMPFCLLVLRTKPGLSVLKFACLLTLLAIPVTVAGTGSRGGLVALGIMFLLYFLPLPAGQKLAAGMVALILAVVAITWSARSALERYKTIFVDSSDAHLSDSERSAMDSSGLRRELLLSSLQLTMRHPLLGVGPGMFAVANADYMQEIKGQPSWNAWHETHNTFTQLSCEDGLPGLFLYCLTLLFCFHEVFSAARRARNNPALAAVGPMAFSLRLALIAFTVTAIFASNAYAYYFPMLAGVCVAFERAVAAQLALAPTSTKPPEAPPRRQAFAPKRSRTPHGINALAWKNGRSV
ncbi:MAG: O-antigen ligase family protein [Bryobacteraceae bacterium]|jgi:O-antigen ligase